MPDQAEQLRVLMRQMVPAAAEETAPPESFEQPSPDTTKVIAITSGKGGVGKSTVVTSLAMALAERGRAVAVMDADLALGNIDVMLGLHPRYNLSHVVRGDKTLSDIALEGPGGITILPASSGIIEMAQLSEENLGHLLQSAETFGAQYDYLLLDTAAGLADQVRKFVVGADEALIVTTPEPTAYTDGYAMIKVLAGEREELPLSLIVNGAQSRSEAVEAAHNISAVTTRFLDVTPRFMGYILRDPDVPAAIRRQVPILHFSPHGPTATAVRRLAAFLEQSDSGGPGAGMRRFLERVLKFVGKRASDTVEHTTG